MPEWSVLLAMAAIVVVAGTALAVWLRRRKAESTRPNSDVVARVETSTPPLTNEAGTAVGFVETGRPGEFVLFGSDEALGPAGHPVAKQLVRHITGASKVLQGAKTAAELSGRVVVVDPKTAEAIRQGTVMIDKAGKMVAAGMKGNKIAHLARMQPLGKVTTTALVSGPAALTAIAMQAQMASIERQLHDIAEGVNELLARDDRRFEATLEANVRAVFDAWSLAHAIGELTDGIWEPMSGRDPEFGAALREAKSELDAEAKKLKHLSRNPDIKARERELGARAHGLDAAIRKYEVALVTVVRYHELRAWRLAMTNDNAALEFRVQTERFLEEERQFASLHDQILEALDRMADAGFIKSNLHWRSHPRLVERTRWLRTVNADNRWGLGRLASASTHEAVPHTALPPGEEITPE